MGTLADVRARCSAQEEGGLSGERINLGGACVLESDEGRKNRSAAIVILYHHAEEIGIVMAGQECVFIILMLGGSGRPSVQLPDGRCVGE
jgi:hypothetical protein